MVPTLRHPKLFVNKVNWAILRENGVLPISKTTKAPLPSVASSSKGLLQEESDLPMVCTSDGFNSDAYKLMEESGYDFSKPPSLGHIIDAKPYGLNDKQKMVQKQGDEIVAPRIRLGYMSSEPLKISRWCKAKWSLTQYVIPTSENFKMVEELQMTTVALLRPTQNG